MKEMIEIGTYGESRVAFDFEKSTNQHVAILGKSGTGKSVAGQKIIKNIVKDGGTVVAFDMHWLFNSANIFPAFKEEIKSHLQEFDAYSEGIPCPLFEPLAYSDGTIESRDDIIAALTDTLSIPMNLRCRQKSDLKRALRYIAEDSSYQKYGIASLEEGFYKVDSEAAESVQEKMEQILTHNVFQDGMGFISDGCINVIRLSRFNESTQILITEFLLSYLWRLSNTGIFREKGLYIFLDECQNLSFSRNSIISKLISEGRKMGLHLILISQSLNGPQSCFSRCILQAAQHLYFAPSDGETTEVAKLVGLSKCRDWKMVLNTLQRGQAIAVGALNVDGVAVQRPIKIGI